jgi:hypothetical protein
MAESAHDLGKFVDGHVGKVVEVDDGSTARVLASNNITARCLGMAVPIQTVPKVNGRIGTEG